VPLLRKELGAHFQSSTGLSNVKLQYTAKKPGLWLDLKEPKPDATILSAVEGAIKGLFPLIKPSVPTSISSLRIIVPDDCAPIMPAEAPDQADQAEDEPKGQAPQAASAQDLAKVLKAFKKKGKEACFQMMLGNDESECFIETLGDGRYVCSICCDAMGKLIINPGKLGEGMSGLARHLLTNGHVQARHARMNGGQGLSKVDVEMLMAGASSTLTFKRYQNTSRATAAKVARIAGEVAKGNMEHGRHGGRPRALLRAPVRTARQRPFQGLAQAAGRVVEWQRRCNTKRRARWRRVVTIRRGRTRTATPQRSGGTTRRRPFTMTWETNPL